MKNMYAGILAKIVPPPIERRKFHQATERFLKKLKGKLHDAQAILGGSGAKDTWLSGNPDADVFVVFNYSQYARRAGELSETLYPLLKKAFPGKRITRLHGSRDYFQLEFRQITFEVIPVLHINKAEQAKNITDISPLHSIWVNTHTQRLKDQIRLLKQFLQAHTIYGAESYINGFSGYVVEILVAKYKSFEQVLRAAADWPVNTVIDVERHYRGKDVFFELNQSKLQSPLVVIDPVDKSRNAAAALSLEKFLALKQLAKRYLASPPALWEELFIRRRVTFIRLKEQAQEKKTNLLYLAVVPQRGKEDVVGVKLLKAFEFLQEKLSRYGIKNAGWDWQQGKGAQFFFFLEKQTLPPFAVHPGPPLSLKEHVKAFKKKHQDTFEEKGKILARVQCPYPHVADFAKATVKEKYVQERVRRVKEMKVV